MGWMDVFRRSKPPFAPDAFDDLVISAAGPVTERQVRFERMLPEQYSWRLNTQAGTVDLTPGGSYAAQALAQVVGTRIKWMWDAPDDVFPSAMKENARRLRPLLWNAVPAWSGQHSMTVPSLNVHQLAMAATFLLDGDVYYPAYTETGAVVVFVLEVPGIREPAPNPLEMSFVWTRVVAAQVPHVDQVARRYAQFHKLPITDHAAGFDASFPNGGRLRGAWDSGRTRFSLNALSS